MLDPWIIEEIRRREEEERRQTEERPVLEMPLYNPNGNHERVRQRDEDGERGVVIVDFTV